MLIFVHHDVESSSSTYYHLYTPHPRAPIATINAIGIITDSDGLFAAFVAGNTVHRPRLLSADDDENE